MSEKKSIVRGKEKGGFLSRFGLSRKSWSDSYVTPASTIDQSKQYLYGAGVTTVASLLGRGEIVARDRQRIYDKWMRMEGDAIISSAISLLVTAALGGHETSGDLVFVEESANAKENAQLKKIVEDVKRLTPIFNRIAFQMAYTGAVYGDSFARVYARENEGVIDVCTDEMVRPQLVQAYERGGRTVGFSVTVGENNFVRLTRLQMARLKMPRKQWIPQFGVIEKSIKINLNEDDVSQLEIMPSMVGGSLLFSAEDSYDKFHASLIGLVGQRWIDSIDEQIMTVNLESMTLEQQERFVESIKGMLLNSKKHAEQAVKKGMPVLERIRHILPIFNEKQVAAITPMTTARSATLSVDDIMVHARLLAGALGVDLSMLGFADQLSGGLGEGGFFRVSAQAAESARVIRVALEDFFNEIIDVHCYYKYGIVFNEGDRPWDINFYGSISALEAEKQRTKADAMNAGMLLVQAIQGLKDMGATPEIMQEFLQTEMMLDEDKAKLYSQIVKAKEGETGAEGGGMPPL